MKNSLIITGLLTFLLQGSCISNDKKNKTETETETEVETASHNITESITLKEGLYVIEGSNCANPSNADMRKWDGKGLSGAATTSCSLKVIEKKENKYTVSQSCVNTYDKSRSSSDFVLIIEEDSSFTLVRDSGNQRFVYCENIPSSETK